MTDDPAFPRPRTLADILTYGGERALAREIFGLLTSPEAQPYPRPDGADKSLRLEESGGWLFKTHPEQRVRDALTLVRLLPQIHRFESRLGVWHPSKSWFVLYDGRDRWLCNRSPVLTRLDELRGTEMLMRGLEQWRAVGRTLRRHGVVLDPHLDNFGIRGRFGPIYYLDDEVYRRAEGRWALINPAARLRAADDI